MIIWRHEKAENIACTVCGSETVKEFVLQVSNPFPYSEYLNLYRCGQCESCFYYPIELPPYADASGSTAIPVKYYCEFGAGIDSMIAPVVAVRNLNDARTILDVGCGFGFNLDFATRMLHWEGVGVEPSSFGAAGRSVLGLTIYNDYLENVNELNGRTFGMVYCSEVIEHVQCPEIFLRLLKRYVGPDGVLVLTTPNAEFVSARAKYTRLLPVLSPGYHINLFSHTALERLLFDVGFQAAMTVSKGQSLVVLAGNKRFKFKQDNLAVRICYVRYLDQLRRDLTEKDSAYDGVNYRLLKELVNAGEYERANKILHRWGSELHRKYGLNVFNPNNMVSLALSSTTLEDLGSRVPFSLVGIYFYTGMVYLNWLKNFPAAAHYFKAGFDIAGHVLKLAPQYFGEVADLVWRLKLHEGLGYLYNKECDRAIEAFEFIKNNEGKAEYTYSLPEEDVIVDSIYYAGIARLQEGRNNEAAKCFEMVITREKGLSQSKRMREAARHLSQIVGRSAILPGTYTNIRHIQFLVRKAYEIKQAEGWMGILKRLLYRAGISGIYCVARSVRSCCWWLNGTLVAIADYARSNFLDTEKMIISTLDGALALGSRRKLCIFSHFDRANIVDDYVIYLLQALSETNCETIFVSTSESLDAYGIQAIQPYCSKIILRKNYGRDFGSYDVGIKSVGDLSRWDQLILANDSIYGPIHDLGKVFEIMEGRKLDVWGITDSWEQKYHLQGYFIVFNLQTVRHLDEFWGRYRYLSNKTLMIKKHEIGLSQWAVQYGYKLGALCEYGQVKDYVEHKKKLRIVEQIQKGPVNPSHFFWQELVTVFCCPFVKIELLRDNPSNIGGLENWLDVIEACGSYNADLIVKHLKKVDRNAQI